MICEFQSRGLPLSRNCTKFIGYRC